MVDVRVERLVRRAVERLVADGRLRHAEGKLGFDAPLRRQGVLADRAELTRVDVLIVEVQRLDGHLGAVGDVGAAVLVDDVEPRCAQGRAQAQLARRELHVGEAAERQVGVAAAGARLGGARRERERRHEEDRSQPARHGRLASAMARSSAARSSPSTERTRRPFFP
jgi:hypothetical protein